jgi:multidrug efflux pump subunit AcrB
MIFVDPFKLMSRQLGLTDLVDAVNLSNLILPAGDVKLGPFDYYVYSNSMVANIARARQAADQDGRRQLGLRR